MLEKLARAPVVSSMAPVPTVVVTHAGDPMPSSQPELPAAAMVAMPTERS